DSGVPGDRHPGGAAGALRDPGRVGGRAGPVRAEGPLPGHGPGPQGRGPLLRPGPVGDPFRGSRRLPVQDPPLRLLPGRDQLGRALPARPAPEPMPALATPETDLAPGRRSSVAPLGPGPSLRDRPPTAEATLPRRPRRRGASASPPG